MQRGYPQLKILFVTTISDTINAFLVPHIKFLMEQGHEVGVAFNTVQEVTHELLMAGSKVHQIEFQRNPFTKDNLIASKKIKRIIVEEGYEFVHVHTPVASFITRFACRNIKNVKVLYTAHGFHFFQGAPIQNWLIYYTLEKFAARWTDGIITMNDEDFHAARRLKVRNRESVYKVHGVGLDLSKFLPQTTIKKHEMRKSYQYHDEDFILIYVGEISHRKHQDLVIHAMKLVKKEIPNSKLLLVGEGDRLNHYKELVSKLDLEEHIQFLGFRKDVNHLMMAADIAISTSRQEGLPVNVMEAMAVGLPLIVTDCRGNRDLVSIDNNGLVVGVDDIEACANAIKKLYHSKELRRKFADQNRELIQQYSLEQVMGEMEDIYSKQIVLSSGMTEKMNKKVSIIMGIFNCEQTIAESIGSIERQTYENWELIMCDDGSVDNTYEIASSFARKNEKIKVLKNNENLGLAKTLNRCLEHCNGEYIMRHDGDDLMLENRIEKQVNYMITHPDCDMCGSGAYLFDDAGVWGIRQPVFEPNKSTMVIYADFIHPTVIMRHEKLLEVNGYSDNKITRQRLEDYDLWLKFYEKEFILHNLQEPLIYFREDKNSYARKNRKFRVAETIARLDACKRLNIPYLKRLLAFKPLIVMLIPKKGLRKYHIWQATKKDFQVK
jgi:glycosyltransferase EpsD